MKTLSLDYRIAMAMRGAAAHVWNLMAIDTERVLTAQDITRHFFNAMMKKNPTASPYYIKELEGARIAEYIPAEGEGWSYDDNGRIVVTVDTFICVIYDTSIFAMLAKFESLGGIKIANRATFTKCETIEEPTMVGPETIEESTMVGPETIEEPTMVEPETIEEPTMVEPETIEEPTITHTLHMWIMSTAAAAVACLIVFISLSIKPHTAATAAPTVATIEEPTMVEPTMVEPTMVECETIDHINEVICTGSIDPYIEKVKEEITRNYRAVMKSQLQEIADNNNEVFAAIEAADVEPVANEITPIYSNSEKVEEIADTLTEEESDTADTITEDQSDTADTLTDGSTYDYSCNGYTVIVVESYDSNGELITASYVVPLNE